MYGRCAGQVIVGPMGDRIDINVLAVRCVMELMRVRDEDACLEQVQFLAGVVFNLQAREAQRKREMEKRGGK